MLQVSVSRFLAAVQEAAPFTLPELSEGANYLYKKVYYPISQDERVSFSDLDFSAFSLEDITVFSGIYDHVLEKNFNQAVSLANNFSRMAPAHKATAYV